MTIENYTYQQLEQAYLKVSPHLHYTPILTSSIINEISGAELYFKCENLQKAGSFKIRGAMHAMLQLSEQQLKNGVVTHSSGNFAQALALAAKKLNVPAYIVMPENAPLVKVDAVKNYGAQIRFCKNTEAERHGTMEKWQKETNATFVHPYNNRNVILGQSTCAYEITEQIKNLDCIISPVGGGGLISGTSLAAYFKSPETKVYGAEPTGANDAWLSFTHGYIFPSDNPNTIADGLLTALGSETFPVIRQLVSDIFTVTDQEIIEAMQLIWTRMKIIAEPSSATTLAVVLKNKQHFSNKKIALIVSGGNVDVSKFLDKTQAS